MNDSDTTFDPSASDAAGTAEPETAAAEASDSLAELRRERDEFQDKWLRQTAEFDNYRKRMERERRDLADHAAGEILHELLPVLDDIERALEATTGATDPSVVAHRQGLELIHRQFSDVLRRRHVTPVPALGEDFDPNVHQAVGQDVSTEHREGEVIEEMRRGYLLKERLLRPSMVKVATRG